jgi:hypothetical protein
MKQSLLKQELNQREIEADGGGRRVGLRNTRWGIGGRRNSRVGEGRREGEEIKRN